MPRKFWRNRNVFVTGGTGLLGSWLVEELVRRGANVVGLVRDLVPRARLNWSGTVNRINVVRGPVEDYPLLERTLNEYEIETVFHLAAQTIVGTANRNPVSTFETNIQGTWNLLEACRRNPLVRQIVVASSDKAYGEQAKLPYDESTPLEGRHPYDVSKSCVDLLCQAYFRTFGTPVCVTRCGNFYGGGDLNFNRIVPGTIRSVLFDEAPVIRSNGTLVRDYFYIEDAVGAYLMLAEKMAGLSINGEAYNFSNEIQVTVLDLTKKVLKLMKSNLKPQILDQAPHEIPHQYLSAKKARRQLGWKPLFTLEQGLKRTIAWYRGFFRQTPMTKSQ